MYCCTCGPLALFVMCALCHVRSSTREHDPNLARSVRNVSRPLVAHERQREVSGEDLSRHGVGAVMRSHTAGDRLAADARGLRCTRRALPEQCRLGRWITHVCAAEARLATLRTARLSGMAMTDDAAKDQMLV
jgi:hypothetical protein